MVGCAPLVIESNEPRIDAPFDTGYAPMRVLADGEAMTGPGWTLTAVATPPAVTSAPAAATRTSDDEPVKGRLEGVPDEVPVEVEVPPTVTEVEAIC